jgi:sirohydrochlorin ferrochelatase
MVPYFLSAGVHLLRDLTAARDVLAARYPAVTFRLGPPLGPHPLLDDLVAVRADTLDADPGPTLPSAAAMAERYAPLDEGR